MKVSVENVVKRDKHIEPFDVDKIMVSVEKAGKDTGEYGKREAKKISDEVVKDLQKFNGVSEVSVQEIRDIVEPAIAKAGYFGTAKYYILYGEKKQRKRKKQKRAIVEPEMADVGEAVMRKRYLRTDLEGKVLETPGQMFWRVARHMAKAEIQWGSNGIVEQTAEQFYERMVNFKFVCAGKAMFEAGNPGGTGQLSSCFVLPVTDNIDSIFKTLGDAAVVHKNNGGTGFNFSQIRPHGDKVRNVPEAASGPVDFLKAYSAALAQILQGAKRQGANIAILNVDHPDIEEFIKLKNEDGTVKNFNVSVGVSNAFMEAVVANKDWKLKNPRNGEVWKTVKARALFDMIAEYAWQTGDPGLAFLDRLEEDNPTPTLGKLEATNPCGEIPLLPYESCNLTSIVLSNHMKKTKKGWKIEWDDLERSVKLGIRFLDDMIEVNSYALEEIRQMVKEGNRRIGLGVMGFAHLLYKLRVAYDSEEAVRIAERLAKFIRQKAEETSKELARQRGPFPNFDVSVYAGSAETYRNCALLMIAPTGTTSLVANASSGIEPVFSLVTVRRSFNEDSSENAPTREFTITDPVFEDFLKKNFTPKQRKEIVAQVLLEGDVVNVKGISKKDKQVFATTHQIAPEWHVKIQAAWQKWIDNSVSKTINFPHDAKVENVKSAYMQGWRAGLKGITIYRDGSKMDQVLNVAGKEGALSGEAHVHHEMPKPATGAVEMCPECGGAAQFSDGCVNCPQCGWSKCSM